MRTLLLDARMAVEDADSFGFSSNVSMYDFDLVIWDPGRSVDTYSSFHNLDYRTFRGRRWLNEDASAQIARDVDRRRREIVEFLQLGRTLAVFVPGDIVVSVETGEKEISGKGRGQKTTTLLDDFDLLESVLPITLRRHFAGGLDMTPTDNGIGPMYRETSHQWMYRATLESDELLHPLIQVSGTTKTVAAEVHYAGGRIILLPDFCSGSTDDEEDPDDAESDSDPTDAPASVSADDELVLQWLIGRIAAEEVEWPSWIDDYQFASEVDRAPSIEKLRVNIIEVQKQLDELMTEAEADKRWKLLVAGDGTALEVVVADALELLGFDLQPAPPGRTDIRGTRNGRPIVVETKGVTKSAAESHSAQLEKWVAEEVIEERAPKGILVINTWKKTPPIERTRPAFPSQMRPYAENRDHCLVTGIQLLNLARAAQREPDRTDELADLLLSTTGVLKGWDNLAEVFSELPERPAARRRASNQARVRPKDD